jgi:ABC-type antimicrobial peptide transport system permease subunit
VKLNIVGMTDNEYDYSVYTDIESLKKYVRRNKAGTKIPGQPLDKDGKAINEWIYTGLIVEIEDAADVDRVSKAISNLGFRAENNKEAIKNANKTTTSVKVLLGIVGTIALIVAIIGIVNTMSTAVYDRMQEIGTLKLIGCDSDDILFMFLFESGILGAIGGAIGVGASYMVNQLLIEKKVPAMLELPKGLPVTYMPWWLAVGAILLAIVVSVLAGAFPARYAARLKPLDAATTV